MIDIPHHIPLAITDGNGWEVGYMERGEFIPLCPCEWGFVGYIVLNEKDIVYLGPKK